MRRTPATAAVLFTLLPLIGSILLIDSPATGATSGADSAGTTQATRTSVSSARVVGQPPIFYSPPQGSFFAYPNGGKAAKVAIRGRVLNSVKGTWGGPRTSIGTPRPENGKIRIATWSFEDMAIAKALVAARARGVSVQVVAARGRNKNSKAWRFLKRQFGTKLARPGYPATIDTVSFARDCAGSCRGRGGTPHAKYFLFDKVGRNKERYVTFQTSMNLTSFGYTGQWNQGTVLKYRSVYEDYLSVFKQARLNYAVKSPYRATRVGPRVADYFFPRPGARAAQDPVMQNLGVVRCRGAGYGGTNGRTKIRIIQYAMYGDRGIWLAKKLRGLWNAGCDVRMIYSLVTRPVLQIMRNRSGRGPIPMRQSVTRNGSGQINKYNHSKWMTITGNWNGMTSAWVTFNGSANWSLAAFPADEQMQRLRSVPATRPYLFAFNKTWNQKTSKRPPSGRFSASGRALPIPGVPEDVPAWGQGVYRFMEP